MPSGDRAPPERFGFESVVGERFDDLGVVAVVRSLSPLGPRGESDCAVLDIMLRGDACGEGFCSCYALS